MSMFEIHGGFTGLAHPAVSALHEISRVIRSV